KHAVNEGVSAVFSILKRFTLGEKLQTFGKAGNFLLRIHKRTDDPADLVSTSTTVERHCRSAIDLNMDPISTVRSIRLERHLRLLIHSCPHRQKVTRNRRAAVGLLRESTW